MTQTLTLEQALADFLRSLAGKNRSAATARAYQTDIQQFITWLHENNIVAIRNVSSSLRQLGSEFKEDRLARIGRA